MRCYLAHATLIGSILLCSGCKATSACADLLLDAVLSPSYEEEQRLEEKRKSVERQHFYQKVEEEAMAQ